MPYQEPYPKLEDIIRDIGRTGRRLVEMRASEGSAGNISVYMGWPVDAEDMFPFVENFELPYPVPELSGGSFLVTGSGTRLGDLAYDPTAIMGLIRVAPDGLSAQLWSSKHRLFTRLTCEFNSHLAVHHDLVSRTGANFNALIHAQPLHLTYLSHIPRYQDERYLNRSLYRWQPECIMQIPEGIGFIPFHVPGSAEMESDNVNKLRNHPIVLWAKHGVMARSEKSILNACDLIDYIETSARYEYMNLTTGETGEGLSDDDIREICRGFDIEQSMY